ncbi:MAG: hypothetical protein KC561_21780, partial [Myxococcales bacterium]|nr:hypothetical protein [Myxococcales bacterium]
AGDDRGGIVLTSEYAFYNGDEGLVRTTTSLTDLQVVHPGHIDTLFADPGRPNLFTLWSSDYDATNLSEIYGELRGCCDAVWDEIAELDPVTFEVLGTTTLSAPVYTGETETTMDLGDGEELVFIDNILLAMRDDVLVYGTAGPAIESDSFVNFRSIEVSTGDEITNWSIIEDDEDFDVYEWEDQETEIQHFAMIL